MKQEDSKLIEDTRPLARKDGLLIEALDDEILIYDTERNKAHCLNAAAAQIWKHCDGKHTLADITNAFSGGMPIEAAREVVSDCVLRFNRAHLLKDGSLPFKGDILSRRKLLRKIGISAAATAIVFPLITSIVAPVAAQTISCASISCAGQGAQFCKTVSGGACTNCGTNGHCRP